jgi:hypothetical protein
MVSGTLCNCKMQTWTVADSASTIAQACFLPYMHRVSSCDHSGRVGNEEDDGSGNVSITVEQWVRRSRDDFVSLTFASDSQKPKRRRSIDQHNHCHLWMQLMSTHHRWSQHCMEDQPKHYRATAKPDENCEGEFATSVTSALEDLGLVNYLQHSVCVENRAESDWNISLD